MRTSGRRALPASQLCIPHEPESEQRPEEDVEGQVDARAVCETTKRVVVRVCALAAQDAHPKQAVEALEEEVGRLRVTRRQLLTL